MTTRESSRYHFPWRGGNHFRLHVDGDDYFPAMLDAIGQARHSVLLEMYLVTSGKLLTRFIDALLAVAQHGVKVFMLLDDFGSRGMSRHDRSRLAHPNISLYFYNPPRVGQLRRALFRDHRKLLVIDDHVAFTGGAGLTDAFNPDLAGPRFWHDIMVEIQGPCVADWHSLFCEHWPGDRATLEQTPSISAANTPLDQAQLGRVTITRMLLSQQEIKRSFIKRLHGAEHWVYMTTAYFVPSWKIRRALRKAVHRGVYVCLLLPGPHTDHPAVRRAGQRFYSGLLKHGVRIFEYQPRFIHAKACLCDQWSSIGSSNLDRWNLLWNLEANQEIDDQTFAEQLKQMFEHDLQHHSIELQYADWRQRSRYHRLLEWFWGYVDVWLNRQAIRWQRKNRRK